jgi:hypothetical protein
MTLETTITCNICPNIIVDDGWLISVDGNGERFIGPIHPLTDPTDAHLCDPCYRFIRQKRKTPEQAADTS